MFVRMSTSSSQFTINVAFEWNLKQKGSYIVITCQISVNPLVTQLLDTMDQIRRLKRQYPLD